MPRIESSNPKPIIEGLPQGIEVVDIGVTPMVEAAQVGIESMVVHAVHSAVHNAEASKQKVLRTMGLFRDLRGRLS